MVVSFELIVSYIASAGAVVMTQPTVAEMINLLQLHLVPIVLIVCLGWLCYSYETRTAELTKELADRKAEVTKLESDRNAEKKLVAEFPVRAELKKKRANA